MPRGIRAWQDAGTDAATDTALELLDRLNSYLRPPALDRKLTKINYARRARLAPINTGERFDLT